MSFQNILFELSDAGVARITLNRPDKMNSFTAAMVGTRRFFRRITSGL